MFKNAKLDFSTMEIRKLAKKDRAIIEWHNQIMIFLIYMIVTIVFFVGGGYWFSGFRFDDLFLFNAFMSIIPVVVAFLFCRLDDFSLFRDATKSCKRRFGDDLNARKVVINITGGEEISDAMKRGYDSEDFLDLNSGLYFSKELWLPELAEVESRSELEKYIASEFKLSLEDLKSKIKNKVKEDKKEKDLEEVDEIILNAVEEIK